VTRRPEEIIFFFASLCFAHVENVFVVSLPRARTARTTHTMVVLVFVFSFQSKIKKKNAVIVTTIIFFFLYENYLKSSD